MRFFQRLFGASAQQKELEAIQQEKLALQDRLRVLTSTNERLQEERDFAMARAESSSKLVANWLALQAYGRPIYTDIPTFTLPEEPTNEATFAAMAKRGRTGRDVVREHTEFFQSELRNLGTA